MGETLGTKVREEGGEEVQAEIPWQPMGVPWGAETPPHLLGAFLEFILLLFQL